MFPATTQALAILAIAVAPGFLASAAWSRSKTWKGPTGDFRTLLQALVLSAVVQIIVAPLTIVWLYPKRSSLDMYPERVATWLALVVVVIPLLGGLAVGWITDYLSDFGWTELDGWRAKLAGVRPVVAAPSVWDWFFTRNPPHGRFLLIEFADGRRVAGVFSEGSIAFTSPEPHGVYLASEWLLDDDGNITAERPDSMGLLIKDISDVRSIRVLKEREDV